MRLRASPYPGWLLLSWLGLGWLIFEAWKGGYESKEMQGCSLKVVTLGFSSLRCLQATLGVHPRACVSVDGVPLPAELLLQPQGSVTSLSSLGVRGDPAREVAGRQYFISNTGHAVDVVSTRPEPGHPGLAVPSSQVLMMP